MAKSMMAQIQRIRLALAIAAILVGTGPIVVQAQIPYVTVKTPRSPGPPMALIQTNSPAAPALPSTVAPLRRLPSRPAVQPSLDKAELDRRVVAFQKRRALDGSASAQYELGLRYLKGDGVEKDFRTACKWLKEAAEGGSTEARKKLVDLDAATK